MGYKEILLKLPTDYTEELLFSQIQKLLKIKEFSYQIDKKSLDARNKKNIHWLLRVYVSSGAIKGAPLTLLPALTIPYRRRNKKAVIVGSGPAGFFSAYILQKAGFDTTIIERGADVIKRTGGIKDFEKTGIFNPTCNYAFGEGGAGTFSDGKLTSRTKHISTEKQFMLSRYIEAGADEEIKYVAHPHLGSDNLVKIVKNLREKYLNIGGSIHFETALEDLKIKDGIVSEAVTSSGHIPADIFIIAPGHSAYETYRMLIRNEIKFSTKNFAIGCRIEHPQEIINMAQWGCRRLPGINAAEYRLTFNGDGIFPVYTFCMCPGGTIVNASAYNYTNVVNGMSLYNRNGKFANAACVAGVNLKKLMRAETTPLQALEWVETLERTLHDYSGGFKAPYCSIQNFINKKEPTNVVESSYAMGLLPSPLWDLLPPEIDRAIREGLKDFCRKINGFDSGIIMGLETKTSSPIQVVREKDGTCTGFANLYIVGEGSGHSGGIISSGVDGIKAAMGIIKI